MIWNGWARKDLQPGDLTALSQLNDNSRWNNPNPGRVERLSQRGFVRKKGDQLRVTTKGRAALLFGGHVRSLIG